MLEAEVNHSNLFSNSSSDRCVGSIEKHTRGLGSNLILKMGYEGKGLGKHTQGMIEPIMVEERPKNFVLGYIQSYGENSKSMKTLETVLRRTFVASSKPKTCQICIQDECHC